MGQDLGRADDPLLARARRDMEAWHIDHVTGAPALVIQCTQRS